jgi:putative ABC transport system substrate-binding protein
LVLALAAGALAAPLAAFAQQPARIARIGFLHSASPQGSETQLQALRDGLRELGYVEGKNYQLEFRWGEGKLERMPALATELVQSKVDIIFAATSPSVVAARQATRTIPIVMPLSSDPLTPAAISPACR